MESIISLWQGFGNVFNLVNMTMVLAGCLTGLLVGALPGISAVNGIALLLPLIYAFNLPSGSALILLAGIYYGAEYGAGISSILFNLPGKSIHLTRLDGFPMAQQGLAGHALVYSIAASFTASIFALVGFVLLIPLLKNLITGFGPAEYVAIILFVFVLVLIVFGTSLVKNLIGLCIGMAITVVGLDSATGTLRFTFDMPELYDGIDFIIVVIGLFTLGESLMLIETAGSPREEFKSFKITLRSITGFWNRRWTILRCSLVGFFIGGLPGTGSSIAGVSAYHLEKRINAKDNTFGNGDDRGVIASESAGSAAAISAFIPLLALGIPGSATTAVLLGAMLMMSLTPGPMFFIQQSNLVWMLVASMIIGNLFLIGMNTLLVRFLSRFVLIPYWILIPIIVVIAFVGVYVIQPTMLSLSIMLALGLLSYMLRKLDYSLVPVILGYILGGPLEVQLRRALAISGGEIGFLFEGVINRLFWCGIAALILMAIWHQVRRSG